jgi:hypothetical protein
MYICMYVQRGHLRLLLPQRLRQSAVALLEPARSLGALLLVVLALVALGFELLDARLEFVRQL